MSLCELELHNCVIHTTDIHKRCIQFPNTSVCLAKCMAVLIYYLFVLFCFFLFNYQLRFFVYLFVFQLTTVLILVLFLLEYLMLNHK